MHKSVAVVVGISIVIGLAALGYGLYVNMTVNDQLSEVNAKLSSQSAELHNSITGLQGTISSLQTSISQNQQVDVASAQQIATLQASLKTVETSLSSVRYDLDTSKASNSASLQQISFQLQNISATIQTLSSKLNAINPQVPQSTLVIVANSYNTATNTLTFIVHNNQETLVYAQISATLLSRDCGFLKTNAGSYISQIYSFKPGQNMTTTLDLHLGSFRECSIIPYISSVTMNFFAAPNIAVSPTYTFSVVPPYKMP